MAKYGGTPHFSPKIFFCKMTQNGLKWILNTTLENVTFWPARPSPPQCNICYIFFWRRPLSGKDTIFESRISTHCSSQIEAKYDFWTEIAELITLSPPDTWNSLQSFLRDHSIDWAVMISDVQSFIVIVIPVTAWTGQASILLRKFTDGLIIWRPLTISVSQRS